MNKTKFIAMSQPCFLPWSGYFDLIDSVDIFIFLNDSKLAKQSWQTRNKIISKKEASWIKLPISNISNSQLINQTKIFNKEISIGKIIKSINQNYSKSKYYKYYFLDLEKKLIECKKLEFLDDVNIQIIRWFIDKIGIKTKIVKSSELKTSKIRSYKITDICKIFEISNYLSAHGAFEYLNKDYKIFEENKINVFLQNYKVIAYNQLSEKFDGFVSILDILFNEGPNTLALIRNNRKDKIPLIKF